MSKSITDYFVSEKFANNMKRVSAESSPFGNSTSSARVYETLAKSARDNQRMRKA